MKERPILFSAPMVRAYLEGIKSQTRRTLKEQPTGDYIGYVLDSTDKSLDGAFCFELNIDDIMGVKYIHCPYGNPGDKLWGRETTEQDGNISDDIISAMYSADHAPVFYSMSEYPEFDGSLAHWWYSRKTCPSIHMPRWASRINPQIISVRVERLNDISEEDAIAEGLSAITKDGITVKYGIPDSDGLPGTDDHGWPWHEWDVDPRKAYRKLWESINGAGSWNVNPWVWVIEFKRVKT